MMASLHTRVDTSELKDLIYGKIGHERAHSYFNQLKNFLNLKLSKVEFDKSCIQTIGRANIPLHNKLIRAIAQNACQAKAPPQKSRKIETQLGVKVVSGYQRSCLQSLYGDSFPQSPRKCRSSINRDRKFRDRPSPLGPLGKSPSLTCEETVTRLLEQQSASELHSLCSKPLLDDGEEVEQLDQNSSVQRWSNITAPLCVSFNNAEAVKSRQCNFAYNRFLETCQSSAELPDASSLSSRLKRKLGQEGLDISMDCVNLLNKSLGVYLRRLIEPCVNITRSRRLRDQCDSRTQCDDNHVPRSKQHNQQRSTSRLDFQVAMESNPLILGLDWRVQLEKINQYALG